MRVQVLAHGGRTAASSIEGQGIAVTLHPQAHAAAHRTWNPEDTFDSGRSVQV